MVSTIQTPTEYKQAMAVIETYLAKSSVNLTETNLVELQRLSSLVEQYEDEQYPMPIEPA